MPARVLRFSLPIVGLLLLAGVAQALSPGQKFKSPLKNFTLEVPSFFLGTKVQEQHDKTSGVVVFVGGGGQLQRIDYFRTPAGQDFPADSAGQHGYIDRLLQAFLQGKDMTVIDQRDAPLDGILTMREVIRFPGGALLQNRESGKALDSVRGLMAFVRDGYFYILQDEVGAPMFDRGGQVPTSQELVERAEESLPKMYHSLEFR